jgi:hypothetical protein
MESPEVKALYDTLSSASRTAIRDWRSGYFSDLLALPPHLPQPFLPLSGQGRLPGGLYQSFATCGNQLWYSVGDGVIADTVVKAKQGLSVHNSGPHALRPKIQAIGLSPPISLFNFWLPPNPIYGRP